jgi:hypothetical protein
MAITLDELLGRNIQQDTDRSRSFPTYDEYGQRRPTDRSAGFTAPAYTPLDTRPYRAPRTEEAARQDLATRPYVPPKQSEYRSYDMTDGPYVSEYERAWHDYNTNTVPLKREAGDRAAAGGYEEYRKLATGQVAPKEISSLYAFTIKDNDRLSERELDVKLSHTRASAALPVSPVQRQQTSKAFTPVVQSNAETYKAEGKKRRLKTKAKVLIAIYIAVIITVAVLIIVNAGEINTGAVVTPDGPVGAVQNITSTVDTADYGATNAISDFLGALRI